MNLRTKNPKNPTDAVNPNNLSCALAQDIMDVHRASNEKRERAASLSKSATGVECQPNAPLLRDEKSRRDWIEHELDMCCQVRV